jgi:hypothetical protein
MLGSHKWFIWHVVLYMAVPSNRGKTRSRSSPTVAPTSSSSSLSEDDDRLVVEIARSRTETGDETGRYLPAYSSIFHHSLRHRLRSLLLTAPKQPSWRSALIYCYCCCCFVLHDADLCANPVPAQHSAIRRAHLHHHLSLFVVVHCCSSSLSLCLRVGVRGDPTPPCNGGSESSIVAPAIRPLYCATECERVTWSCHHYCLCTGKCNGDDAPLVPNRQIKENNSRRKNHEGSLEERDGRHQRQP